MKKHLIVAGIDAGLTNTAVSIAKLNLSTGVLSTPHIDLVETSKDTKAKVRVNCDDLRRATEIHRWLHDQIDSFDVDIIMAEMPVGSQSSRGAMSYGLTIGVLSSIRRPMIQVLPLHVKNVTGSKSASKLDMIKWASSKFPKAKWLTRSGKLINKNEHMADATAALLAGLETADFKLLLAGYRAVNRST